LVGDAPARRTDLERRSLARNEALFGVNKVRRDIDAQHVRAELGKLAKGLRAALDKTASTKS
jgi:hypothetical protein